MALIQKVARVASTIGLKPLIIRFATWRRAQGCNRSVTGHLGADIETRPAPSSVSPCFDAEFANRSLTFPTGPAARSAALCFVRCIHLPHTSFLMRSSRPHAQGSKTRPRPAPPLAGVSFALWAIDNGPGNIRRTLDDSLGDAGGPRWCRSRKELSPVAVTPESQMAAAMP